MKRILFFLICLMCFTQGVLSQSATYGIPVGLGRNNCGSGGSTNQDSMYFFNYVSGALTRATYPNAYKPRLKIGPLANTDRWSIFAASISFNPKDQKLYYLWTDYSHVITRTGAFPTPANTYTYIWRWKPDTTFTVGGSVTTNFIDTLRSFPYDIGGVAFDNNGIGWTLEFPPTNPCARAFFRPIDFAGNVYNTADTLDFTSGPGGIGDTLWNPGSGDITMLPSGQIYYNFDNKLYTPDYGSYGGPTHHIKSTYIDTTKRPTGTTALVGLAFSDGDLVASYATGCIYRRLDPVTGDTNNISYTYTANKGVYSVDMTQINSGIGSSKKLVSVTPTGTANQYDVVYDVYVKNYGTVPITNIQVSDNLALINGIGNVSNVTAAFTSNPAGLSINPLYNGTVVTNLLLGTQTLPNYPTSNNNFTIRISCRLSNIQAGVVYNNQAVATAGGFNNIALRDSSTNGNNPDLNQNDKPDDVGESQPTPFVIILTPVTAPCTVLGNILYTQDFGSGLGLKAAIPTSPNTASTTYIGTTTAPLPVNRFTITNNAVNGDGSNWISLTDHTGGANGNMMVVNADASASIFYRDTLPVVCPGQQYSVSLWAAFIGNSSYQTTCNGLGGFKYPKFLIRIRDLSTGLVITQTTTADITSTSWTQYGMKFGLPAGYSNLILEIVNAGPGGCGNDVAIDDIQFGSCSAAPTVNVGGGVSGCLGTSTTFSSALSDPTAISGTPVYQWQVSSALAGPYVDIAGATSATYTIPSLAAADTGKYYRVIVASSGNIGVAACQYISPALKLLGLAPSVTPTSVSASAATICLSGSTTLTANGGSLGTGANYQWGTGNVVGTNPIAGATSSTLTVSPGSTTTYWVQIQNTTSPCAANSGGITTVVTVNQPSVAPSSISGADFCNPGSTTLTVGGGALGTGANYQWGTGNVVGTSPIVGATSSTLTVSPTSSTTYWVRIENTSSPCTAFTGGVTKIVTVMQPSVAPASVSVTAATICNSGSTTLTANGATLGTGANYQWGTGNVVGTNPIAGATSSTLTVSPASTTTYWVQVQNTTSPCTAATGGVTRVITVNQPSVAPSSISGADFCNPGSTTLTAGGGSLGTGANYQWGTGNVVGTSPIAGATSSTLTVSPTSTTTYWVRIENGTAPCSLTTGGITKVVTVTQPSVAPASVSATAATICLSGSTTLTANGATLGTGANYQWGTGNVVGTNPIAGATSSTLTVSPSGTTTYWVQVQNTSSPCTAATGGVTSVVTVNQPSVAPSSISGADFCNPGSTTLTAGGGSLGTGANYQWGTGNVVGTSPIAGATSSTLTVSPTSTITYWVRIENGTAPCSLTTGGITKVITVTQPSVAPASVSATATALCGPGSTTLTANGATLGTGANYQWGTGNVVGVNPIAGATSSTLTVSVSSTTTYWVQVQNTSSPCAATTGGVTRVITVNQASVAPTSVTGLDFCNPGSTTLTAGGGSLGTGANYQWGTGNVIGTSPIAGATSSTLTVSPTSTTTYWVRIENGTAPCSITTSGLTKVVTVSQPSVAAVTATKNKNNICPGISVSLGITGGTLGTGASWKWYTGSPGGVLVGTGSTLTVTPAMTTTYYVRAEGSCNTTADQSVTVFISCDIDKDKDGIPDFVESGMAASFADANSNGVINAYDPAYAGFVDNNNDYINDNFQADGDSDNDGIPNYLDTTFPGRVDSNGDGVDDRFDADKDGIINMLDLDSDNDGIPDVVEAYGVDTNGDGKIDGFADTDGDGLSQNVDGNNTGAYNTGLGLGNIDLDGDGVPNFIDLDSDNDGIPDVVEVYGPDTNNDGIVDGFVDANNDGLHDGYINGTALLVTGADINGDGKADSYTNKNLDRDLRSNAYDIDSDGDGIVDVIEAGLPDVNLDGKVDGVIGTNGWSASVSGLAVLNLRNTDGFANPDYLDIDADDDGIPDNIEGQSTAGYKLPVTTDTDGDGLVNTYDNVVGFGGSGIFVWDQDGDGIPDYRDLDTDGDGQPDRAEGNDFNLNGIADDLVTLTGLDTDGDGLDNRFDSLNSVTNIKGTSYMMGNSGSLVGDATPGTRSTVQKKTPGQLDRDWRFVGSVLPVQFLGFTASTQNTQVLLSWTIITTKEVDHFEIERSLDNTTYNKVGTVSDAVKLNEPQSFGSSDDITGINNEIIYYRLKVVGKTGEIKYSNVLVVRRSLVKTPVAIMPNPANDYVSVKFFAEKESEVTLRLVDNLGKTVLVQKQRVSKGNNILQLNNLAKYSAGVYTLQVFVNAEIVTHKLILER